MPHTFAEWIEKDHGRIETRRCWAMDDLDCLGDGHKWPQAKTLAVVEAIREINGVVSTERRYYISQVGYASRTFYLPALRETRLGL